MISSSSRSLVGKTKGRSKDGRSQSLSERDGNKKKGGGASLEMSSIGVKNKNKVSNDAILRSAETELTESVRTSKMLKFQKNHEDLTKDDKEFRSSSNPSTMLYEEDAEGGSPRGDLLDGEEEIEVINIGGTEISITRDMVEANKRLKRYQLIFLSPSFYRSDHDSLLKQRQIIQAYLTDAVQHPRNRVCPDLLVLFEVSATSFMKTTGPSLMEGTIKVRCSADSSDRSLRKSNNRACCGKSKGLHCFCCVCFCFRKRMAMKRKKRYSRASGS